MRKSLNVGNLVQWRSISLQHPKQFQTISSAIITRQVEQRCRGYLERVFKKHSERSVKNIKSRHISIAFFLVPGFRLFELPLYLTPSFCTFLAYRWSGSQPRLEVIFVSSRSRTVGCRPGLRSPGRNLGEICWAGLGYVASLTSKLFIILERELIPTLFWLLSEIGKFSSYL
jgi:hypothetical protein